MTQNLISHDSPIGANDSLDREPLAQRIAEFIKQSNLDDEGVTISVEAPWGDGKSWMLSRIKASFNGNPNYQVVAFSPWLVGSHEKLTIDFLNTLYTAFNKKTDLQKAANAIAGYIRGHQQLLDIAALGVDAASDGLIAKFFAHLAGWAVKRYEALTKPSANMPVLYEQIRECLQTPNLPRTVVLIDDIDRLQPSEVAEVIRLIQSVGRLPNVVYVLAIEPGYVIDALQKIGHANAAQFLDKIVQLRITLPRQRYSQLARTIEATLNQAASSSIFNAFQASELDRRADQGRYLRPLIAMVDNLRDWKRIWNRFRFVEQGIRGQVNPIELLVLSAIAIKTPKLYEKIVSHPEIFTFDAEHYASDKISKQFNPILTAARTSNLSYQEKHKQQAQFYSDLQTELDLENHFVWPLVDELFLKLRYPGSAQRPNRSSGRLQLYTNLRLALTSSLVSEQLTTTEFSQVIFEPDRRNEIFQKVRTSRYLWEDLLFELDKQRTQAHEFKTIGNLLAHLAELSLVFDDSDFFTLRSVDGFIRQWIEAITEKLGREEASVALEKIVTTLATSYAGDSVLARTLQQINASKEDSSSHYYQALREAANDTQRQDWSVAFGARCIARLDSGELNSEPRAQTLFWYLPQISPSQYAKITESSHRFLSWCEVMAAHNSGGNHHIKFHSTDAEEITLLGGQTIVSALANALPDAPAGMISWKAALLSPGTKFIVGTVDRFNR